MMIALSIFQVLGNLEPQLKHARHYCVEAS